MKLKDFCETFKEDLTDQEFIVGYLEDALEEGGVSFFIDALEDVIQVNQQKLNQQLLNQFKNNSQPEMFLVWEILNSLGLSINLKVKVKSGTMPS